MSHAMKALVLSALGFPGLGQLALKRYRRGAVLLLASLAALALIVAQATRRAIHVLGAEGSYGGAPDQATIARALAQSMAPSDSLEMTVLLVGLLGCWVYAAVDAYRIGQQQDRQQAGDARPSPGRR